VGGGNCDSTGRNNAAATRAIQAVRPRRHGGAADDCAVLERRALRHLTSVTGILTLWTTFDVTEPRSKPLTGPKPRVPMTTMSQR
jgi:hypothetical protein